MSDERDLRKEWERFFEEERLIRESHEASLEAFRRLGREAAERKNAAVLAALENQ